MPICSNCDREATHYEKDTDPRRWYCGRHAGKWAKRGVAILESWYGALQRSLERERVWNRRLAASHAAVRDGDRDLAGRWGRGRGCDGRKRGLVKLVDILSNYGGRFRRRGWPLDVWVEADRCAGDCFYSRHGGPAGPSQGRYANPRFPPIRWTPTPDDPGQQQSLRCGAGPILRFRHHVSGSGEARAGRCWYRPKHRGHPCGEGEVGAWDAVVCSAAKRQPSLT